MKATILPLLAAALWTSLCRAETPASLEVHEWGTFTTVSGSGGTPLQWWQPYGLPATELPPFVAKNLLFSKGGPYRLRMETPVLYFYPEKPMTIEVRADMPGGNLTDFFPAPKVVRSLASGESVADFLPGTMPLMPVTWSGRLIQPVDTAAAAALPQVTGQGAEYLHAREVPEAWFFQSENRQAKTVETEKFIFYRGAANTVPPYRLTAGGNDNLHFSHLGSSGAAVDAAFAVHNAAGALRWSRLPRLAEAHPGQSAGALQAVSVDLSNASASPAELVAAMTDALVAAGLSESEAKAMVATWNDHWFAEEGTRVLAILPQVVVDTMLPLTIHPTPKKTTRVFVARFETFTPQREAGLLALLDEDQASVGEADRAARFQALHLGRFAPAALARAQELVTERLQKRFALLNSAALSAGN